MSMKTFSDKTKRRLALLRRLKKQREGVAKQAFDRARGEADAIRVRIAGLESSLAKQTRAAGRLLLGGSLVDLSCYATSMRDTQRATSTQINRLADAEKPAAEARDRFIAARKKRQATDVLADQIAAGEAAAVRRTEAKELDEITTTTADAF